MLTLALTSIVAATTPLCAQELPRGIVDDWSHHHAIFSTPAKELDALKSGHYSDWYKLVTNPRYIMQQKRRNAPIMQPTLVAPMRAVTDLPVNRRQVSARIPSRRRPRPNLQKDWSMNNGASAIAANAFPAKYQFSTTAASCSDYVVYPTGSGPGNATVIAYSNIYAGTCTGTVPTVAWAYNTGGTSTLSPVISQDGTQVAYIQTASNVASLVLLKPLLTSGGTVTTPAAATLQSAANYPSCTAPCYTTLTLNGSPNDTNSSPFYVYYSNDTMYVGDDSGKVHKFTGVFTATPAEVTTGGWPVTASTTILTSPVFDSGTSQLLFVGDSGGYLHSITTTGTTSQTVLTSNRMVCGTSGMVDPPIVDSTTENVYVFVGYGCDTNHNSYVNRFAAGTAITNTYGQNYASFANSGATNPAATNLHTGTFDNTYYSGTGNTGFLYGCVNGVLYQVPMSGLSGTTNPTVNKYNTMVNTVGTASACSPITEFYNGTHDWLFMSVAANGSATGCTGACLYNFNVQGAGTTGNVTDGIAAAGGTSGISIDNSLSGAGESQIYYSTLSSQTCAGNGTTGSGSGTCAVQTSQSAP